MCRVPTIIEIVLSSPQVEDQTKGDTRASEINNAENRSMRSIRCRCCSPPSVSEFASSLIGMGNIIVSHNCRGNRDHHFSLMEGKKKRKYSVIWKFRRVEKDHTQFYSKSRMDIACKWNGHRSPWLIILATSADSDVSFIGRKRNEKRGGLRINGWTISSQAVPLQTYHPYLSASMNW